MHVGSRVFGVFIRKPTFACFGLAALADTNAKLETLNPRPTQGPCFFRAGGSCLAFGHALRCFLSWIKYTNLQAAPCFFWHWPVDPQQALVQTELPPTCSDSAQVLPLTLLLSYNMDDAMPTLESAQLLISHGRLHCRGQHQRQTLHPCACAAALAA